MPGGPLRQDNLVTGGVAMVRTFGGGIYDQFTNLFVPEAISEEHIPPELREAVAACVGGGKRKWYAATPAGDVFFAAVDFEQADPPGRFLHLALWQDSGDPLPCPAAQVVVPVRFDKPFGGAAGTGSGVPGPGCDEPARAGGWAWDRRVAAVAGITDGGDTVKGKPVNGCWLLVSQTHPGAGWSEFRALDRRGKVLYSQTV